MLGRREPVRFLDFEREGEEDYGDFDFLLYTKLTDARELAVRILQDLSLIHIYPARTVWGGNNSGGEIP